MEEGELRSIDMISGSKCYRVCIPSAGSLSNDQFVTLSKEDFSISLARFIGSGASPWYDKLRDYDPRFDASQKDFENR